MRIYNNLVIVPLAALTLLLGGCATTEWLKDGATAKETKEALRECEGEAAEFIRKRGNLNDTTLSNENSILEAQEVSRCMEKRGFIPELTNNNTSSSTNDNIGEKGEIEDELEGY